jgi:hypothetical protein
MTRAAAIVTRGACAGLLSLAACGSDSVLWAPRVVAPERPPRDIAGVSLTEMGRPNCSYEVIGSAFGSSLAELRTVAAEHGADGVYDTSCGLKTVGLGVFQRTQMQCAGRAFVCQQAAISQTEGVR